MVDADGYRLVPEQEVAERFGALIARMQAERAGQGIPATGTATGSGGRTQ
jgi:hypothetical protein